MNARPEIELPSSIDSEESVLGGLMLQPESLALISDWIEEKDFFLERHRVLFRAITELTAKGSPVDAVTMVDWAENTGAFDEMGGATQIYKLTDATPSSANIVAYAEIVAEKSRLRQVADKAADAASKAVARGANSQVIVSDLMHDLAQFQAQYVRGGLEPTHGMLKSWFAELMARYEHGSRVTGLASPWPDLDDATHGLQPGDLVIVAARPNMGKSVFGFNLATRAALNDLNTAVFSLEMTKAKVMNRCVASLGNVSHDWLMAPSDQNEEYWPRVTSAAEILRKIALQVDDTGGLTYAQIIARARRAHLRKPLKLVVVDHLHIIRGPGRDRARELGEMTRAFKALAKELNCPVVLLAQLNRGATNRADRAPTMTDLRDSGEIEQDADLILFLHREDYYMKDETPEEWKGVVQIEIGKGRDVKTGHLVYAKNCYDVMRLDPYDGPAPRAMVSHKASEKGGGRSRHSGGPGGFAGASKRHRGVGD